MTQVPTAVSGSWFWKLMQTGSAGRSLPLATIVLGLQYPSPQTKREVQEIFRPLVVLRATYSRCPSSRSLNLGLRVRVYEDSFLYRSGPAKKFAMRLLTRCSTNFDPIFDPITIAKWSLIVTVGHIGGGK